MPGDVVSRGDFTQNKVQQWWCCWKKSAKLALFTQELFPGGLFGASCLFSWLWWTVSWTLRCTLPSAVKHNATRLHHSRVWGYRWPAVCLCSSPLGQLEPSISAPPVYPRCVCLWGPDQQHSITRVSHRVLWGDTFMRLFFLISRLFGTIPSDIFMLRNLSRQSMDSFGISTSDLHLGALLGSLWWQYIGISLIQLLAARAVTGLSPSADGKNWSPLLCSWRGVFICELSGTLLKKVAIMYSVWFSGFGTKGYPHPPANIDTHMHILGKRVNMSESTLLWDLSLFIKTGIDSLDRGLQRAS